ncbi:hypothetical protein HDU93_005753, partial [Gonapodya sp. JEL0774]
MSISVRVNPSEIQWGRQLGKGTFSVVYEGLLRGERVAIKKMEGTNVDDGLKEAAILLIFSHKYVLRMVGVLAEGSLFGIVTEFMDGGTLFDYLHDATKPISPMLRWKWTLQFASGMHFLHDKNIQHRDLKSHNLLLDSTGTMKIADVGLAKFRSDFATIGQVGTPLWMAPELRQGSPFTHKCDVYSFGVILWEIATRAIPPMPPVAPLILNPQDEYAALVLACTDPDPAQRPSFAQILDRVSNAMVDFGRRCVAQGELVNAVRWWQPSASEGNRLAMGLLKALESDMAGKINRGVGGIDLSSVLKPDTARKLESLPYSPTPMPTVAPSPSSPPVNDNKLSQLSQAATYLFNLFLAHRFGLASQPANELRALDCLWDSARLGSALATFELAEQYRRGSQFPGFARDFTRAIELYRRAASAGHSGAQ